MSKQCENLHRVKKNPAQKIRQMCLKMDVGADVISKPTRAGRNEIYHARQTQAGYVMDKARAHQLL